MYLRKLLVILTSLAILLSAAVGTVSAAPPVGSTVAPAPPKSPQVDNIPTELSRKQDGLRQSVLQAQLQGDALRRGRALGAANGQYVDFPVNRTDHIFVIIVEFGNYRHPSYPDLVPDTRANPATTFDGPHHNAMPEPDRSVDNTTIWQADYNTAHYESMYFNQMKAYYKRQSSGRYTFDGVVSDWVSVPYNEARYGRNVCGSNVCSNTWHLIRDGVNHWVADQLAAGMTLAEIQDYLADFDVWDRYDYDGDCADPNGECFDEPDGYIDHFQIVHAGGDEAAGGFAQGEDAIWSHRWYAYTNLIGVDGPSFNRLGGTQIGGTDPNPVENVGSNPTGVWVGDYTIQPENGGLGVFAHEYAHDLGLPDQYDTSGGENSTGFWTIMSSGSYLNNNNIDIGSAPDGFNAWEKFQLGWLKFEVAFAGQKSEHKLSASQSSTKQAQGLFVVLPDKEVATNIGDPPEGNQAYWSDRGASLDNTMTREVTIPAAASVQLSMQAWYHIEACWDYAYVEVSTDGTTFNPIQTSVSTTDDENGQNFGYGITGTSGEAKVCDHFGNPTWVPVTADLSAFAGQTIQLRFRYWTDGFVDGLGFEFDDLEITADGSPVLTDGAEDGGPAWTFDGFRVTTGVETADFFNAYVVENRQYVGDDANLRTGAYNFGFLDDGDLQNWVERFPYQDGVLISYWDDSFTDNNTSLHPGGGLILPIDAHPDIYFRPDNAVVVRARILSYDSTFTLERTQGITVHFSSLPLNIPSKPGVSLFNDMLSYWSASAPFASVQVPHTGTTIRVQSSSSTGFVQVAVNK